MRIALDGQEKISENWTASDKDLQANKSYSFDFPSGKHTVSIASEGSDWFTVDSVRIDGIGNAVSGSAAKAGDRILMRLDRGTLNSEPYLLTRLPASWRLIRAIELDLNSGKVSKRSLAPTRGVPLDCTLASKNAALILEKVK